MILLLKKGETGKKICAAQDLERGTQICEFTGELLTFQETLEKGKEESFGLQVGPDKYLFLDPPYRYFNHACEPNCGLKDDFKLVCLRDIQKGEELRYDYSTTMLERHWTMSCECGAASCRKVVRDFDLLPPETQKKYLALGIVQKYIVRFMNQ